MKISERWLREWTNPPVDSEQLQHQLTMAGLEVDNAESVAADFTHVVVAEVKSVSPHPNADRLTVCEVDAGQDQLLQIVCGAKNVVAGIKVPAALIGAVFANGLKIKKSKLRGVESQGMLCSAVELGLAEDADGLMILPEDAPVGQDIRAYLQLDDMSIDIDLTPNRGDCLSVMGVAREVSGINQCAFTPLVVDAVPAKTQETFSVNITAKEACPRYAGRVIRNIDVNATTPLWMQERLRRSGLRSISPVVDITNYVMLELGQPMHAFDLDLLNDNINVRFAIDNEKMTLLDGKEVTLKSDTLVIADKKAAIAMAGIMGGEATAVNDDTQHIFLESAFFSTDAIAGQARQYGLSTDSSHRFERGVDPALQVKAIERATKLLLDIVGGEVGPVIDKKEETHLPAQKTIDLRRDRVSALLGVTLDDKIITDLLTHLHLRVEVTEAGWQVAPPSYRFDLVREIDLIEEIARLYGYDNIPTTHPIAHLTMLEEREDRVTLQRFTQALCDLGYHEAVTYSFVDDNFQKKLDTVHAGVSLLNPISSEMNVMRTTLLSGLLSTLKYNQRRQQNRVRLFETGLRFVSQGGELLQQPVIAGVVYGSVCAAQWGVQSRKIDFYDIKGDVENLFQLTQDVSSFQFVESQSSMLHPRQSADIVRDGKIIGFVGMLNPKLYSALDVQGPVGVFEMLSDELAKAKVTAFDALSKFPEISRDIALLVDASVSASVLVHDIKQVAGPLLVDVNLFDVYTGQGVPEGQKSLAFSLSLQAGDRTLTDEEVTEIINTVSASLHNNFGAVLRD